MDPPSTENAIERQRHTIRDETNHSDRDHEKPRSGSLEGRLVERWNLSRGKQLGRDLHWHLQRDTFAWSY